MFAGAIALTISSLRGATAQIQRLRRRLYLLLLLCLQVFWPAVAAAAVDRSQQAPYARVFHISFGALFGFSAIISATFVNAVRKELSLSVHPQPRAHAPGGVAAGTPLAHASSPATAAAPSGPVPSAISDAGAHEQLPSPPHAAEQRNGGWTHEAKAPSPGAAKPKQLVATPAQSTLAHASASAAAGENRQSRSIRVLHLHMGLYLRTTVPAVITNSICYLLFGIVPSFLPYSAYLWPISTFFAAISYFLQLKRFSSLAELQGIAGTTGTQPAHSDESHSVAGSVTASHAASVRVNIPPAQGRLTKPATAPAPAQSH